MKLFHRTFLWIIATVIAVALVTAVMMRLNAERTLTPNAEQHAYISEQQRIIEARLSQRPQANAIDEQRPPRINFGRSRGWVTPVDDELATGPTVFFRARGKWMVGPIHITANQQEWAVFMPVPPELARQLQLAHWLALSPWWALAVFMVLGLCAFVLARQLSGPILTLERQAQPMAQGDFGVRIAAALVNRSDEVGELAQTLNHVSLAAHEALTAQRRLLADVSHEFRSPLGRISMAAALMQRKQGTTAELDRIQHEVQLLNALVGELLELSRDTMAEPVTSPCSLSQLVAEAAEAYSLNERQIKITSHLPSDDLAVQAVPALLRKIIHNLMDNAVRYAHTQVWLELEQKDNHVTLTVADDGDGVAEVYVDDLLKPFFRPEDARQRTSGGVGLGLAIVKSATTMLGGSVAISRAPQGGLAVCVNLPLA